MDEITKTLVAGSASGIVADLTTHPICTVKARLMVQGAAAGVEGATVYRGLLDGVAKMVATEGPLSLYKGIGAVVVGAAPAQALFFGGMTFAQTYGTDLVGSSAANFGSGFFAQLVGSLAWVPMEVVKEKMMIQGQVKTATHFNSSFDLVAKVLKTEGIGGFYRGYVMQQFTYAPFNAFAIYLYNEFKKYVPTEQQGAGSNLACSSAGYAISAFITTPFDVIKTRQQVQTSNPELFNYNGPLDILKQVVRKEGMRALFDGWSGRVAWLTPRCAIAMTAFETFAAAL